MRAELVVAIVVVPLDGRVLNCAVHALDLTVRPRMVGLGQPVFSVQCSMLGIVDQTHGCPWPGAHGLQTTCR